jgi:hypothetical protein
MDINQPELTEKEQSLIKKVLNFHLNVNKSTIYFQDIADNVDLELSHGSGRVPEKKDYVSLGKQAKRITNEIKELVENCSEILVGGGDVEKISLCDRIGELNQRRKKLEDFIKSDTSFVLLGESCPQNENNLVILYINNIIENNNNRNDVDPHREDVLITVFIHEMFHAWNYFASGCKARTIREIDEAMVEYGTLYFLENIAETDSDFIPIKKWAQEFVKGKQQATGSTAAYGYGYYLYTLREYLIPLEHYGEKAGIISSDSQEVEFVVEKLYPFYPSKEEKSLLEPLSKIIS